MAAALHSLPETIGALQELKVLRIAGCISLEVMPRRLPPVDSLIAPGCTSLRTLPEQLAGFDPEMLLMTSPRGHPIAMKLNIHNCPVRGLQRPLKQ